MRKSEAKATLVGTMILALSLIPAAILSDTLIITADTGNNRIQVFDSAGTYVTQWGRYGKADGEMSSPAGIAAGRHVYAADTGNHRIQEFNYDGTWISTWGGTVSGQVPGMFSSPNSLAVNIENCAEYVYVADTGNNRIQKFTAEGAVNAVWEGTGRFNNPQGIFADPSGRYIYVADTGNNRIQKLDTLGNMVLSFGGYGTIDGKFKYPRDVAVDSRGRVYVADNMNYRIQRFSPGGVFELKWGAKGEGDGQFWDHYGVSVDGQDNIYAADAGNNRVQVFTADGVWLKTIGSVSQGIDEAEFYYPMGVDVHYDKAVSIECMPTMTFTETFTYTPQNTPTYTFSETFTETSTDTATETPTDTATETPTDTATETPTDTATETPTDTATETPTDTATETPTDTATETPTDTATETPTDTATETPTDTATETPVDTVVVTPEATPAGTAIACTLCYSVRLGNREKKTCDVPDFNIKENKKGCKEGQESLHVIEYGSGYIYYYRAGSLRISIYDEYGCFRDEIEDMEYQRKGKHARHFTAWYVKHGLKKHAHRMIPSEYYIASLFPSSGLSRLEVSKNPPPPAEMDGSNTYNYPNPCAGSTIIRFSLPASRAVDILISDISGRLMWQKRLNAYETIPGANYVPWEGTDDRGAELANGTYMLRVISGDRIVVKKISIAR